jgi:hypothetical protein
MHIEYEEFERRRGQETTRRRRVIIRLGDFLEWLVKAFKLL